MYWITLVPAIALIGCAVVQRNDTPQNDQQLSENYSHLARCTSSKLENDSRWWIRTLVYEVRTYPDIESAEVTGRAVASSATFFAFQLTLTQVDSLNVQAYSSETTNIAQN